MCPDEALYNKFNASFDSNWIIEHPPVDPNTLLDEIASQVQVNAPKVGMVTPVIRSATEEYIDNTRSSIQLHDEDDPSSISANLKRMALKEPNDTRFFGESSEATLARTAIELKKEYVGNFDELGIPEKPAVKHQRLEFWTIHSVRP